MSAVKRANPGNESNTSKIRPSSIPRHPRRPRGSSSRRSLLFFVPYFSAFLDFPSPPLSAPGSPRMIPRQIHLQSNTSKMTSTPKAVHRLGRLLFSFFFRQFDERIAVACENIRFSSLFATGDVSRGGAKRSIAVASEEYEARFSPFPTSPPPSPAPPLGLATMAHFAFSHI